MLRTTNEATSIARPSSVEHDLNRFGVQPVLLDQDSRRKRLDGVAIEHRNRRLYDDRTIVEIRGNEVNGRT